MGSVYEQSLVGEDLLRHIIDRDGRDRTCCLKSTVDEFKAGEPAFIDCALIAMRPASLVDVVRRLDENVVNARSLERSHDASPRQLDGLDIVNRTLAMSQGARHIDENSALVPEDVEEARRIASACSGALQTLLPGSYHYWLMRRELLKLVEVHPALEDFVSIPFMQEQENKRWACVHAVMQGEKYMAYCASGKRIPRHPDPCDRAISKRSWEKSMRNWRQELGDM